MQTTVFPRSANFFRQLTTFSAMNESRPEVGSSQNSNAGFVSTSNTRKTTVTVSQDYQSPILLCLISQESRFEQLHSRRLEVKDRRMFEILCLIGKSAAKFLPGLHPGDRTRNYRGFHFQKYNFVVDARNWVVLSKIRNNLLFIIPLPLMQKRVFYVHRLIFHVCAAARR